jgi:hypothetical protein
MKKLEKLKARVKELEKTIDRLKRWSHPPMGQDQIYDRLDKIEKELNARKENPSCLR